MREVIATVLENIRIAEEVYSLTFAAEEIPVRAGQFCMIGVGAPLRRPFALCKAEGERYTVCYRVKGAGTRALAAVRPKDEISVLMPLGNGFVLQPHEKTVAVVGGGVGVFPLIAAIRAFCGEREVYSFMGFRNRAAVCMQYEMQRSKELVIATDDGSAGYRGTAVQAFMENVGRIRPDAVLACGPLPMLKALKTAVGGRFPVYASLEERMGCGIGACLVCVCNTADGGHARVCKDGPVFDLSKISL